MSPNIKIAVIGGAGKSGQFLVRELIRLNIPFRLLLRNPSLYQGPGEVIQGDVRDAATVLNVCQECTAVISTLGQPKGEPPVFSQATRNILAAMERSGINRYILTTGLNVDTPTDKKGPVTQAGTDWMKQHYPSTTKDKQLEYELLEVSNADWTLVRCPMIGLTEESGSITTSLEDCPGNSIHGIDLAGFLVDQLQDSRFIKKAPFLAN